MPAVDVANDKRVCQPAFNYQTERDIRAKAEVQMAGDIGDSDIDWSDDGCGGVHIAYGWSNRASYKNMFLAAAQRHPAIVASKLLRVMGWDNEFCFTCQI